MNKTCGEFYIKNDYYKFHDKNVVYIAYIGKIGRKETYKYGVTKNLFKREYEQHRKTFNKFEMCHVKPTYNIYQAEDLLEKELKLRNMHTTMRINGKLQTELFTVNEDFDLDYIKRLVNRLSKHVDKDIHAEISALKKEIKTLKVKS